MSKKAKIFTGVGIVTISMVLFKVHMILSNEYFLDGGWFGNVTLYTGLAILFGGLVDFICNKKFFEEFKTALIIWAIIIIGCFSYYSEAAWMYISNIQSIDADKIEMFIESIKCSELPYLYMFFTIAVFIITLLSLSKGPRYVKHDFEGDTKINFNVEAGKVRFVNYDFTAQLVKNIVCLRQHECGGQHFDLGFLNTVEDDKAFDETTDKFYMAEYDGKPMGYFVIRKVNEHYEIIDFYASVFVDSAFQVLYIAMTNYLENIKKASVSVKNVGLLQTDNAYIIEMFVKNYTGASYQMVKVETDGEEINYDICFKA